MQFSVPVRRLHSYDAHLTYLSTRRFRNNTVRNWWRPDAHVCRIWYLLRVTEVRMTSLRRAGRATRRADALPYGGAGTRLSRGPSAPGGRPRPGRRAIGSAGERLVHTEEVTGSIPVSPTRSEAMWVSTKLPVGAIPVAKWSASRYAAGHGGQAWLGRRQHLLRSLGGVPRP